MAPSSAPSDGAAVALILQSQLNKLIPSCPPTGTRFKRGSGVLEIIFEEAGHDDDNRSPAMAAAVKQSSDALKRVFGENSVSERYESDDETILCVRLVSGEDAVHLESRIRDAWGL